MTRLFSQRIEVAKESIPPSCIACEESLCVLHPDTLRELAEHPSWARGCRAIGEKELRYSERLRRGDVHSLDLRTSLTRDIACLGKELQHPKASTALRSLLAQHDNIHRDMERRERGKPQNVVRESGLVALLPMFDASEEDCLSPDTLAALQPLRAALEHNALFADRMARGAFLLHGYRCATAFNPDVDEEEERFHKNRELLMADYRSIAMQCGHLLQMSVPPWLQAILEGLHNACQAEYDTWSRFQLNEQVPLWNEVGNLAYDFTPPRWIAEVPKKKEAWEAYWGKRQPKEDNPSIPTGRLGEIDAHSARIMSYG